MASSFRSVQVIRLMGVVLLIAAPSLSLGNWYSNRGPIDTAAWFEAHGSPRDSLARASARYHASHAVRSEATRWNPTGYGTLGLAGTLLGAALVFTQWLKRPSEI